MNSTVNTLTIQPSTNWLEKIARKRVFDFLHELNDSRIILHENDQQFIFGVADAENTVDIYVHHPRFYALVGLYGTIGAGEAYMSEYWRCDNLVKLIRIFARNLHQVQAMDGSSINLMKWIDLAYSRLNQNSITGSSRNIAKHYDLGNAFFKLFLDSKMMYSSAMYGENIRTLEQASENKLIVIGNKLELSEKDHLLEIGTGWGGLAIFMAQKYGCKVTTTTISNKQYNFACLKVKQAGLEQKITVLKQDYRSLVGEFDKLVSIEMIEAVGHKYLPAYFQTCNRLLKPGGKMLIQAITMPEQRYKAALRQVDFIQKYIFPGGCLPSVEIIQHHVGKYTQLQLQNLEDMTHSYALTLAHWRKRFTITQSEVSKMGFDTCFILMWEFYLSYCEAGFRERSINTSQLLFHRN